MRSFWQRLRTTPTQNNETDDNDQASPVTPTSAQSPSSPAAIHRYRTEMLQVSVLVAMPSRIRSQRKNIPPELKKLDDDDDDEEPLPELALGITKVHRKSLKADGQTLQTTPPSPVELPSWQICSLILPPFFHSNSSVHLLSLLCLHSKYPNLRAYQLYVNFHSFYNAFSSLTYFLQVDPPFFAIQSLSQDVNQQFNSIQTRVQAAPG